MMNSKTSKTTKNTVSWLSSSRSGWCALQCRCQPTPGQPTHNVHYNWWVGEKREMPTLLTPLSISPPLPLSMYLPLPYSYPTATPPYAPLPTHVPVPPLPLPLFLPPAFCRFKTVFWTNFQVTPTRATCCERRCGTSSIPSWSTSWTKRYNGLFGRPRPIVLHIVS